MIGSEQLRRDVVAWMVQSLHLYRTHYEDSAGCCELTLLAETCSEDMNLYGDDWEIPEWVFDAAVEASEAAGGFNE